MQQPSDPSASNQSHMGNRLLDLEVTIAALKTENARLERNLRVTQEREAELMQRNNELNYEKMHLEVQTTVLNSTVRENKSKIDRLTAEMERQANGFMQQLTDLKGKSAALISSLLPKPPQALPSAVDSDSDDSDCEGTGRKGGAGGAANVRRLGQSTKAARKSAEQDVEGRVLQLLDKLYTEELSLDEAAERLVGMRYNLQLLMPSSLSAQPSAPGSVAASVALGGCSSAEAYVDSDVDSEDAPTSRAPGALGQAAAQPAEQEGSGSAPSTSRSEGPASATPRTGLTTASGPTSLSAARTQSELPSFVMADPARLLQLVEKANALQMQRAASAAAAGRRTSASQPQLPPTAPQQSSGSVMSGLFAAIGRMSLARNTSAETVPAASTGGGSGTHKAPPAIAPAAGPKVAVANSGGGKQKRAVVVALPGTVASARGAKQDGAGEAGALGSLGHLLQGGVGAERGLKVAAGLLGGVGGLESDLGHDLDQQGGRQISLWSRG